jgi:hypothetical protein
VTSVACAHLNHEDHETARSTPRSPEKSWRCDNGRRMNWWKKFAAGLSIAMRRLKWRPKAIVTLEKIVLAIMASTDGFIHLHCNSRHGDDRHQRHGGPTGSGARPAHCDNPAGCDVHIADQRRARRQRHRLCAEARRHVAEALGQSGSISLHPERAEGVAVMEIDVALQGKAGLPVWEAGLDTFRWSTRRDDAERETERERESFHHPRSG